MRPPGSPDSRPGAPGAGPAGPERGAARGVAEGAATDADLHWMDRALAQARLAADRREVPVGAVIVAPSGFVAEDHNRTRERADPTAHAEMLVVRRAAAALRDWRLLGHTLYVTLEPCAMCAGVSVLARVPRLVFGTWDPRGGMCGSLFNLVQDERLNHRVELVAGVREAECAELLREFFRERR